VHVPGGRSGGTLWLLAGGPVEIAGVLRAIGRGRDGDAGDMVISSDLGGVTLTGRGVRVTGGNRGFGGTVDIGAAGPIPPGGNVIQSAPVIASTRGDFRAGFVSMRAGRDLVLGSVDLRGEADGGQIEGYANGTATIGGPLRADGDPRRGTSGAVRVQACGVEVAPGGVVSTMGTPAAGVLFVTLLRAGASMTIVGTLVSGGENRLEYGAAAPSILSGAEVAPPPVLVPGATLGCAAPPPA